MRSEFVQRLQGQYGNHYVQRVLAVARKEESDGEVSPDVEDAIHRAKGGGQPLDHAVRRQMESSFGGGLDHVRVHTDAHADALNRALSARAFTVGSDIFFRQGAYNPGASSGRELIAHETTHVVQQGTGQVRTKLAVNKPGDRFEQEADATAKLVIQAEHLTTPRADAQDEEEKAQAQLQRQPEEEEEPIQTQLVQLQLEEADENEDPQIQTQPRLQRQPEDEEETAQAQLQRQPQEEEEKTSQPQLQRLPEEEEETAHPQLQRQLEDGEETTQPQLQRQADEDDESLQQQLQRQPEEEYEQAISRLAVQRQPSAAAGAVGASPPAGAPIRSETQTKLPTVEQAARDLTLWFAMPNPGAHSEEIFRAMLLLKGRGEELKQAFRESAGRDLMEAIDAGLSRKDAIRAKRYLQYGTLRLADKLFFAAKGGGTDEDTLYRLSSAGSRQSEAGRYRFQRRLRTGVRN